MLKDMIIMLDNISVMTVYIKMETVSLVFVGKIVINLVVNIELSLLMGSFVSAYVLTVKVLRLVQVMLNVFLVNFGVLMMVSLLLFIGRLHLEDEVASLDRHVLWVKLA